VPQVASTSTLSLAPDVPALPQDNTHRDVSKPSWSLGDLAGQEGDTLAGAGNRQTVRGT